MPQQHQDIDPVSDCVIVVIGGDPLRQDWVASVPPAAYLIAADSGLDHALAAGLEPELVVGDFDSVSAAGLAWARDRGVALEAHPRDKNSTDTELALATALARRHADRALDIVLLSGGGDRLDHSIGAITALGHPRLAECRSVSAWWGDSLIQVLHGPRDHEFPLPREATFSLLALHGRCCGVHVDGARWPLEDAVLEPGSSLGVSNVSDSLRISVSVAAGVLTVIVPDHIAHDRTTVRSAGRIAGQS